MDSPTLIVLGAFADLAVGGVIAGALTLAGLVIRDAHRNGIARVRQASALEARDLSRLDRLDGLR